MTGMVTMTSRTQWISTSKDMLVSCVAKRYAAHEDLASLYFSQLKTLESVRRTLSEFPERRTRDLGSFLEMSSQRIMSFGRLLYEEISTSLLFCRDPYLCKCVSQIADSYQKMAASLIKSLNEASRGKKLSRAWEIIEWVGNAPAGFALRIEQLGLMPKEVHFKEATFRPQSVNVEAEQREERCFSLPA